MKLYNIVMLTMLIHTFESYVGLSVVYAARRVMPPSGMPKPLIVRTQIQNMPRPAPQQVMQRHTPKRRFSFKKDVSELPQPSSSSHSYSQPSVQSPLPHAQMPLQSSSRSVMLKKSSKSTSATNNPRLHSLNTNKDMLSSELRKYDQLRSGSKLNMKDLQQGYSDVSNKFIELKKQVQADKTVANKQAVLEKLTSLENKFLQSHKKFLEKIRLPSKGVTPKDNNAARQVDDVTNINDVHAPASYARSQGGILNVQPQRRKVSDNKQQISEQELNTMKQKRPQLLVDYSQARGSAIPVMFPISGKDSMLVKGDV